MAQWSFPFQDINGDRVYSDADFAHFFQNLFTNGVFMPVGHQLQVKALDTAAMKIAVADGAANINGRQFMNTADVQFNVPVASTSQDRVDSVVVRLDIANRSVSLAYKQGVTAVVRTDLIWELQLAQITVVKNASAITAANISDSRGNSALGGYASPFESVPTDGLVAQYGALLSAFMTTSKSTFENWFNNLVDQLSDNQATNLQAQIDTLNTAISAANALLATKADDSKVVHNTGAETIAGAKTFTGDMSVNNLAVLGTLTQQSKFASFTSMYGLKIKVYRFGSLLLYYLDGGNTAIGSNIKSEEKLPVWARPSIDAGLLPYSSGRIAFNTDGSVWTSTALPAGLVHGIGIGWTTNAFS
jgi:hypothetical protein